jgi:pyruvate/2-oxoglutarate dehydrogenase complex dihydrolipoamide dehydrogenase (E3) component
LEVVGIEASLVGGECPYWACLPSKRMIRNSDLDPGYEGLEALDTIEASGHGGPASTSELIRESA